jgi:hypothetical protein
MNTASSSSAADRPDIPSEGDIVDPMGSRGFPLETSELRFEDISA